MNNDAVVVGAPSALCLLPSIYNDAFSTSSSLFIHLLSYVFGREWRCDNAEVKGQEYEKPMKKKLLVT